MMEEIKLIMFLFGGSSHRLTRKYNLLCFPSFFGSRSSFSTEPMNILQIASNEENTIWELFFTVQHLWQIVTQPKLL